MSEVFLKRLMKNEPASLKDSMNKELLIDSPFRSTYYDHERITLLFCKLSSGWRGHSQLTRCNIYGEGPSRISREVRNECGASSGAPSQRVMAPVQETPRFQLPECEASLNNVQGSFLEIVVPLLDWKKLVGLHKRRDKRLLPAAQPLPAAAAAGHSSLLAPTLVNIQQQLTPVPASTPRTLSLHWKEALGVHIYIFFSYDGSVRRRRTSWGEYVLHWKLYRKGTNLSNQHE